MKKITHYFGTKNIIFKEFEKFDIKFLNSKKKLELYCGTTVKNDYFAIFIISSKSRFLIKNAQELLDLCEKLVLYKEHNFKKKYLLISSPICSKAKEFLKDNGWSVQIAFD